MPDADGLALITGVRLAEGATPVTVVAHRPSWTDATTQLKLTATTPRYTFPVRVSSAPLRWPLTALAGLVALGAIAVTTGRRQRRHADAVAPADSGSFGEAKLQVPKGQRVPKGHSVVPEDAGLVGEVGEPGGLRALALAHVAGGDVVEVLDGLAEGHGLGVDRRL